MNATRDFRIGCGAGFSSDRLDPAVDLARRGRLDVLVFECIGERTLAFGHRDMRADASRGYNPLLERRMRAVLPLTHAAGTRVVTNMGVANPMAAAERTVEVARELGLDGLVVAALLGDDVSEALGPETPLWEGMTVGDAGRPFIGANAYLGADEILLALETGADVVITGRVADPSLFVAPLRAHFDWDADDWNRLGPATAVGHLLECASQVTGGYFADPGYKQVDGLAFVGFPFAEVRADGGACITKLDDTGGLVDERTVKEQLLYEVHDPARYLTPDVTADFSTVSVTGAGKNRVRVDGAGGAPRPEQLKVTVAFDGGWLAEAGVSYAGRRCTRACGTGRRHRARAHAPGARHQRAGPNRSGRSTFTARERRVRLPRRHPRRARAVRHARVFARRSGAPALGGRVAAVLRAERRRRLSRRRDPVGGHVLRILQSRRGLAAGRSLPGMSRTVTLREIAHARAGDKGNRSNVSVFAFDPAHYGALCDQVTAERLEREFGTLLTGPIVRHELPALAGLNFVMDDALEGGVNESLNLDGHGKSWSSLLLGLEVTLP